MRARVSVREGERAAGGVPGRARGRGSIAVASRDDFRKNKFSSFEKNGFFFAAKKVHTPSPPPPGIGRSSPTSADFRLRGEFKTTPRPEFWEISEPQVPWQF